MTNNPSVAVLLTAYNGIRWIKDQVDSILNQENANIDIYISVDLSSDGTYEWCQDLAANNTNVKVLPYGNYFGGAAKNFFRLIKDVDFNNYHYISLADQDDIWLPNKVSRAIKIIRERKLEGYSSSVIAFWEDGRQKFIDKSYSQKKFDHYFESAGPGCTFLLTQKSLEKFKNFLIENWVLANGVELHDWIIYAYFRTLLMKWYIDKVPLIYYRQHKDNQIGANFYWKAYLIRLKKINNGWYRNEVQKIINLLKPYARDDVNLNRFYLIKNFFNLRRRLRDAIILLFLNIIRLF